MDLTPLYDLRDRLRAGAIAGAALSADDFRLKRALDALAPLEQAAPVFAKLGQLTRALLAPDCPDRAGALLDAITLADALLCTQGAVAVATPLAPITLTAQGAAVANAPYSVLAPLLDALTTSGSGKYNFVLDTHNTRPELFDDYRVKAAMVQGLGASYSELADQVEAWLSAEDSSILPLLQAGFDPKGKTEMVRRIHVMEAIGGSGSFFLAQLPHAEKAVRAALIYALRHDVGNDQILVDLCKTEKGAPKKMAHFALAQIESPIADSYWAALAAKKPAQVPEYMLLSRAERASGLMSASATSLLDKLEQCDGSLERSTVDQLQILLNALMGKHGPVICACWRRLAALSVKPALDWSCITGNQKPEAVRLFVPVTCPVGSLTYSLTAFSEVVPLALLRAVIYNPTPDLLDLADELFHTYGALFAAPALAGALITKPAGEAFALAEPLLHPDDATTKKVKKQNLEAVRLMLWHITWHMEQDGSGCQQRFSLHTTDPVTEKNAVFTRPLYALMDQGWYDALIALGGTLDDGLSNLIRPDDEALCQQMGAYFYRRALVLSDSMDYLRWMHFCHWDNCEDLAVHYCKDVAKAYNWRVENFIRYMPGSANVKAEEAQRVLALIESGAIPAKNTGSILSLQRLIQELRDSEPVAP